MVEAENLRRHAFLLRRRNSPKGWRSGCSGARFAWSLNTGCWETGEAANIDNKQIWKHTVSVASETAPIVLGPPVASLSYLYFAVS